MSSSAGRLVWISIRPLGRLVLTTLCGFAITKADLFPAVAVRGTGQILINITLPSLFFSRIVTSISTSNASAIGPLILIALLYEGFGFALAFIIKRLFWVPHRFRWGIVVASVWANWGDIPNAILTSVTLTAPFNGTSDSDTAIAYLSIILLMFSVTLFPCGGHRMIAWDFRGPDVEDSDVRDAMKAKSPISRLVKLLFSAFLPLARRKKDFTGCEKVDESTEDTPRAPSKHVSFSTTPDMPLQNFTSPAETVIGTDLGHDAILTDPIMRTIDEETGTPLPPSLSKKTRSHRITKHVRTFAAECTSPRCLAIIVGLITALVKPLKALFTPIPSAHIPNAPDGEPPLAFILDTTDFIGNACVPLGLICLGSALARMRMPRGNYRDLPLGAIISLAVGKLIVMPIVGVLICQGLAHSGVIDPNDKVLRFVCILISATPTATTQVYMTQLYSGTGSAEHLSPFLLPQYVLMVFSTTTLIAISMNMLF